MAAIESEDMDRVVKAMLAAERFDKRDMANMLSAYDNVQVERGIWWAMEICMRDHGVAFGPIPKFSGVYRRLDPGQLEARAGRQRRAGVRKVSRAAAKIKLSAAQTTDDKERERRERAASRAAERAAYLARRG